MHQRKLCVYAFNGYIKIYEETEAVVAVEVEAETGVAVAGVVMIDCGGGA